MTGTPFSGLRKHGLGFGRVFAGGIALSRILQAKKIAAIERLRRFSSYLEARAGVEPTYTDLQSMFPLQKQRVGLELLGPSHLGAKSPRRQRSLYGGHRTEKNHDQESRCWANLHADILVDGTPGGWRSASVTFSGSNPTKLD